MTLIKCKECGKEISDTTNECVHCECPLGKAVLYVSANWTGLASKYIILDNNRNTIAKLCYRNCKWTSWAGSFV